MEPLLPPPSKPAQEPPVLTSASHVISVHAPKKTTYHCCCSAGIDISAPNVTSLPNSLCSFHVDFVFDKISTWSLTFSLA